MIGQQLQRAAQALHRAMQKVAGASVKYTRGSQSASIDAVRARSTFTSDDQAAGMPIQATSQDFIIEVAALVLGGANIIPQAGDRISVQIEHGNGMLIPQVFEVMDPPFTPADSAGQRYRVHAKQVA